MHTSLHAYVCMYVYIYIHTCIYLCIVSVVLTTTDCTRYWWEIGFMGLCIGFVHWYFQVVVRALQEGFGEYMMVHSYSGSLGSLKNSIDYFFSFYLFFFPPPGVSRVHGDLQVHQIPLGLLRRLGKCMDLYD